ncbi:MAG: hypothetical protein ACP5TV_10855 [Anaerolineae bacterium]
MEKALQYYERALVLAETSGEPALNILVRLGLSRCQRAIGICRPRTIGQKKP